jgi:hypothetical protein
LLWKSNEVFLDLKELIYVNIEFGEAPLSDMG